LQPICSGRYINRIAKDNLNDEYVCMDVRTDDYRAKIKNVHEDNLFKNEDEIYQMDYKILKFDNLINKLSLELDHATEWTENSYNLGEYVPKYLKECHFDFILKWYSENIVLNPQQLKRKAIMNSVTKMPVKVIQNWQVRFNQAVQDLRKQKAEKIPEWQNLCKNNFYKSLDHRSFFFKNKQKDLLPIKK